MKKAAIGVDIGGTSVKLGLVDARGKILVHDSFATKGISGRTAFLGVLSVRILALAAAARKRGLKVAGVGIGAPGPIDVERGFVYSFPNIPGWENTPFKKLLEKKLKMKVFVDNDANVMAMAEFYFGAGKGSKNMVALTLGTGVGGGLVVDGKLFHGSTFSAAEIGHFSINEDGPLCACGNRGCIETYVGNGYIVKEIRRRLAAGQKSLLSRWLKEGRELTPKLTKEAAAAGDVFSRKIWEETGGHLGTALAGLVNILNPDRIVLGGGVAQEAGILFAAVRRTIAKKAFPIAARSAKVMPAKLGAEAGLVGAAALVLAQS